MVLLKCYVYPKDFDGPHLMRNYPIPASLQRSDETQIEVLVSEDHVQQLAPALATLFITHPSR